MIAILYLSFRCIEFGNEAGLNRHKLDISRILALISDGKLSVQTLGLINCTISQNVLTTPIECLKDKVKDIFFWQCSSELKTKLLMFARHEVSVTETYKSALAPVMPVDR